MEIEVRRNGEWCKVPPQSLTDEELCDKLSDIQLDSDEFIPQTEIQEGYAVINEAVRRISHKEDA